MSCRACGGVEPGTPAWGDGESCPGGGRSFLQGLWGWTTGRTGLAGWESCPGGGRSLLQGLWGRRTGHTGLRGWGVLPRGWSECPAGPVAMDNRAHRPGGMGSPAQGVVGVSLRACGDGQPGAPAWRDGSPAQGVVGVFCRACGGVEPGTPAWGDGESCPGGGRSVPQGLWGWTTGRTGLGGWGVLPRGWSECP